MGLVLPALLIIGLLGIKELLGASRSRRVSQLSNLVYIPVLPLLIVFGLQAAEEISSLPAIG